MLDEVRGKAGTAGYADAAAASMSLAAWVCQRLGDLVYGGAQPRGRPPVDVAAAVGVSHELRHLAGRASEGKAECEGMAQLARVAERLGAKPTYARRLAVAYREQVHPRLPAE